MVGQDSIVGITDLLRAGMFGEQTLGGGGEYPPPPSSRPAQSSTEVKVIVDLSTFSLSGPS